MSRWVRRLVVLGICAWLAWGCGSEEPTPPLSPTPPELPSTPEVPSPETEATEIEAEAETTTDPVEVVAPSEVPALPPIDGEATVAPPMPELEELEHENASFEMSHGTTNYDEVAYPPAVQGALLRQLRAAMRELLEDFVFTPETDEFMGSYYDAECRANLALPELVAYTCVRTITEGRGEMEIASATKLFGITGENVRALEADDFLIPGTDLGELAERYEVDTEGPMTLTDRGVGFVNEEGEVEDIAYEDLGALIDPRSAAGRVPGVAAIAAVTTQLALDAGPPESISVLTPARPLSAAALFASAQGAQWIFADPSGASVTSTTPMVVAAVGTSVPPGASSVSRPWSTPLRVRRSRLHRAAQLRPAPRRPAEGAMLPAGTVLYAVLGDTAAGASRTGGGQWTLVAVSETRVGWLPSALVRDSDAPDDAPNAAPSIEAFVASVPEAERAAVRASCTAVEYERGLVLIAERGASTLVGLVPRPGYGAVPANRMLLTHPGHLLDVRVAGESNAFDSRLLVILTWAIEGDDGHVLLEVVPAPATGLAPGAPLFTATLASPSAAARERQSIAVGVTRRGRYAPLVVRGPGRAETRYVRSGETLIPAVE